MLSWCLPPDARRRTILGDLSQEFVELAGGGSPGRARRWYWKTALAIGGRYLAARLVRACPRSGGGVGGTATGKGWGNGMSILVQDVRFALRSFVRAPGFTFVALLTLALGIGASSSMFSVVHGIAWRPLAFQDSDRLTRLQTLGAEGQTDPVAGADFLD
jgi:hypothetical protein